MEAGLDYGMTLGALGVVWLVGGATAVFWVSMSALGGFVLWVGYEMWQKEEARDQGGRVLREVSHKAALAGLEGLCLVMGFASRGFESTAEVSKRLSVRASKAEERLRKTE